MKKEERGSQTSLLKSFGAVLLLLLGVGYWNKSRDPELAPETKVALVGQAQAPASEPVLVTEPAKDPTQKIFESRPLISAEPDEVASDRRQFFWCDYHKGKTAYLPESLLKKMMRNKRVVLLSSAQDFQCLSAEREYSFVFSQTGPEGRQFLHHLARKKFRIVSKENLDGLEAVSRARARYPSLQKTTMAELTSEASLIFPSFLSHSQLMFLEVERVETPADPVNFGSAMRHPLVRVLNKKKQLKKENSGSIVIRILPGVVTDEKKRVWTSKTALRDSIVTPSAALVGDYRELLQKMDKDKRVVFVASHPGDYSSQNLANLAVEMGFKKVSYYRPGQARLDGQAWSINSDPRIKLLKWSDYKELKSSAQKKQTDIRLLDVRSAERRKLLAIADVTGLTNGLFDRSPSTKWILVGLNSYDRDLKSFLDSRSFSQHRSRVLGTLSGGLEQLQYQMAWNKVLLPQQRLMGDLVPKKLIGEGAFQKNLRLGFVNRSPVIDKKDRKVIIKKARPRLNRETRDRNSSSLYTQPLPAESGRPEEP
ncbi:MAG: hypothetical protein ACK5P7_07515 [Bdellovibrio sp.]